MYYVSDKLKSENKQAMRAKLLDQNVAQFDEELGKNGKYFRAFIFENMPPETVEKYIEERFSK